VDLHLPAGDADVVHDQAQELLALLEVEFVDACGCSVGEVGDSLLEAVLRGEFLTLGDELVALGGECVMTGVDISCSPLDLGQLEQAGLVEVGQASPLGAIGVEFAG
jgi:hypothetical protein